MFLPLSGQPPALPACPLHLPFILPFSLLFDLLVFRLLEHTGFASTSLAMELSNWSNHPGFDACILTCSSACRQWLV